MGWVGLVAELVPLPELGTGLGLVTDAAAGTDGAGVTRVEEVVEDGVTAADWLRELEKTISIINSLQNRILKCFFSSPYNTKGSYLVSERS